MTPVDPRAVEAAARAEYEHTEHDTWDQAHPDDRADWLDSARIALEAAQGIMWAQVLREVATGARTEHDHIKEGAGAYSSGFHYALTIVDSTADELDPQ